MIFLVLGIVLALVIALVISRHTDNDSEDEQPAAELPDDCCGAHEVCESDSLLRSDDKIEYYADEELDDFIGKEASYYDDKQIELFREVLYTLKEREVAGWLKSLQLRNVHPPHIIREEALMIVADRRGL
ncbi:MAG: hypothetical protein JEZ14_14370 [Marinilabiliaceae bacterium]|nr:hypothetical protein [Marinilabiliaceae bacterium]